MHKAILIYNHQAGSLGRIGLQNLMKKLKRSNIDAVYQVTDKESELDQILKDPPKLVIAAGGDGTVRGVVKRILEKDSKLLILPMGTANNFARSAGIDDSIEKILDQVENYETKRVDTGKVIAPWGENIFIEGIGFGFFADLLHKYRPETKKKIGKAITSFLDTVYNIRSYKSKISIDSKNITGNYLLVEILNSKSIGPRLSLNKNSSIDDGILDVVRITRSENVASVALNLFADNIDSLKGVKKSEARRVEFEWNGFPLHIDDEVFPDINDKINYWYSTNTYDKDVNMKQDSKKVMVEIMHKQLNMLLPRDEK